MQAWLLSDSLNGFRWNNLKKYLIIHLKMKHPVFLTFFLFITSQTNKMAGVNLFGAVRVTKAFAPLIRKNKGRTVNISSILGRSTVPHVGAYCITKHGMEALSNVIRREMKRFDVKVCTIEPGNFVNTTGIIGGIDEGQRIMNQSWDNLSVSLQGSYGQQTVKDSISFHNWILTLSVFRNDKYRIFY